MIPQNSNMFAKVDILTFSLRLVNMTEAVSFLPLIWWHPYQMTLGCQSTSLHRRMMIAKCTSIVWRCFTLNGSHSRVQCDLLAPWWDFLGARSQFVGAPAWICLCGHTVFANWICLICQYREQWSQVERYLKRNFLSALCLWFEKYIFSCPSLI